MGNNLEIVFLVFYDVGRLGLSRWRRVSKSENVTVAGISKFWTSSYYPFQESIDYQDRAPTDRRNSNPLSTPHMEPNYHWSFTIYLTCVFYLYLQPTSNSTPLIFYHLSPVCFTPTPVFCYCFIFILGHLTIIFWPQWFNTMDVCHDPFLFNSHSLLFYYLSFHAWEMAPGFSKNCLSLH